MDEYKPHIVKRNGFWKLDFSKCSGRQLMRYEQLRKREALNRCRELNERLVKSKSVKTVGELIALGWLNPKPGQFKEYRAPKRNVAKFELCHAFPSQAFIRLECGHDITIKFYQGDKIPTELRCLTCKE